MKKKITAFFVLIIMAFMALTGCGKSQLSSVAETTGEVISEAVTVSKGVVSEETKQSEPFTENSEGTERPKPSESQQIIDENGTYTSKDDVALYISTFGHLPDNYITKNEAKDLGWVSSEGNLSDVAPGKSIGGDRFGNHEGLLPEKTGRKYYECDIDYVSGTRNAKRIIFSNDGLVYYTEDHYQTFEKLYGEE